MCNCHNTLGSRVVPQVIVRNNSYTSVRPGVVGKPVQTVRTPVKSVLPSMLAHHAARSTGVVVAGNSGGGRSGVRRS